MESKRYSIIYSYEKEHWWYKGRRLFLQQLIAGLQMPKDARILDVGCGGGYTLHSLSKYGEVFGVDNNRNAVQNCQKRGFKNVVLVKDGISFPFKKHSFDLITCLDVLEHVKDEDAFLLSLRDLLKREGKLIIFVPAFPILWSQLDISSQHYRRYRSYSLSQLFLKNKFIIDKLGHFNSIFFLPILLIRLLQKTSLLKESSYGIYPKIGSPFLNNVLFAIFSFELRTKQLFPLPFGVSLYATLHVPTSKPLT